MGKLNGPLREAWTWYLVLTVGIPGSVRCITTPPLPALWNFYEIPASTEAWKVQKCRAATSLDHRSITRLHDAHCPPTTTCFSCTYT